MHRPCIKEDPWVKIAFSCQQSQDDGNVSTQGWSFTNQLSIPFLTNLSILMCQLPIWGWIWGRGDISKLFWRIPGIKGCAHTWHGHFCAAVLEGSRNPGQWWLRLHMRNYTMSEWIFAWMILGGVWGNWNLVYRIPGSPWMMCQLPALPRYRPLWRKLQVEIFTNPFRVSRLCNFVDLDKSAFYLGSMFV